MWKDGFFEITSIGRDLNERFSLRTKHINRVAEERGVTDPRDKDQLRAFTREWERRASQQDFTMQESTSADAKRVLSSINIYVVIAFSSIQSLSRILSAPIEQIGIRTQHEALVGRSSAVDFERKLCDAWRTTTLRSFFSCLVDPRRRSRTNRAP